MKSTERKLISELMRNSRRSDRELAKVVGVSQPTVSRMIKKLENDGYIKEYTIVPDFRKLGYHLMSLIFVKLKQGLSSDKIQEARRIAQETLKTGAHEVVMLERGIGLGYDGVFVTLHKDYASYLKLKKWFRQFSFLELSKLDAFLVNLDDKVRYRPLTFSTLAKHALSIEE